MNRETITVASLLLTTALATTGCATAVLGGAAAGLAAGGIAQAAGASTVQSVALGVATGAVAGIAVHIIAKRRATEYQRQVAEARARAIEARLPSQEAPTRSARTAKKRPRYMAVDTVRTARSSPKAQKAVMIWDTQSQEMVGNNVYELEQAPPVGSAARFETYSAEYVGSGS